MITVYGNVSPQEFLKAFLCHNPKYQKAPNDIAQDQWLASVTKIICHALQLNMQHTITDRVEEYYNQLQTQGPQVSDYVNFISIGDINGRPVVMVDKAGIVQSGGGDDQNVVIVPGPGLDLSGDDGEHECH